MGSAFTIDLDKRFPRLPNAPIVEAVIHWQAQPTTMLEKSLVGEQLRRRFANYACEEQHQFEVGTSIGPPGRVELRQETRWDGFRLTGRAEAERFVVQFKPNGVVFSRLAKYDRWDTFQNEALAFWETYKSLARPAVIERLGVRFINQVELGRTGSAGDFLKNLPASPHGIPLASDVFLHHDTYEVRGQPYRIHWLRAVQPFKAGERVLIVDIDVFTHPNELPNDEALKCRLAEMRYLKNELFFACMSEHALKQFDKGPE